MHVFSWPPGLDLQHCAINHQKFQACVADKEDTSDELETDNDSDGVDTGTLKDGKTLEEVEVAEEDFQSESEVSNQRINNDDDDTQSNDMSSDPHVESPVVADDE